MTPAHGFMAASAPAERGGFSTKRKAMDLPSGDQAACLKRPVTWVSCLVSPVARFQRKICSWPGLESLAVQVEVKARIWLSGDQTGSVEAQAVAPLGATIFSLAGLG